MEDIYSQLHDARMENASNRAEQTKLKREKKQLEAKIDNQEQLIRNLQTEISRVKLHEQKQQEGL